MNVAGPSPLPRPHHRLLPAGLAPVLSLIIATSSAQEVQTQQQRQLDIQTKALTEILAAADHLCVTPPIEEHNQHIELTGDAKAKLDGIVSKVVDLGIGGAAKYQSGESKGVLQEKLADALKNSSDCKITVLTTLKSMIPGLNDPAPTSDQRSRTARPDINCDPPMLTHNQPIFMPNGVTLQGMILNASGVVRNGIGHSLQIIFRFSFANGQPLRSNLQEPMFREPNGTVATFSPIGIIGHDPLDLSKLSAPLPYVALNFSASRPPVQYPLAVVAIALLDGVPSAESPPTTFSYSF